MHSCACVQGNRSVAAVFSFLFPDFFEAVCGLGGKKMRERERGGEEETSTSRQERRGTTASSEGGRLTYRVSSLGVWIL